MGVHHLLKYSLARMTVCGELSEENQLQIDIGKSGNEVSRKDR
jgi:hypothetical protein